MSIADFGVEPSAPTRAGVRERALQTAREITLQRGWGAVRMGSVASQIGISRQTLHAEFGTKQDLGLALVMREADDFFSGVQERLARHPGELARAVEDAATFTLDAAAVNPLLHTILTGAATAAGDDSLLPLLTVRGEPLLSRAAVLFGDWVTTQWPEANPQATHLMVDSVVRLIISHALLPTKSAQACGRDLAEVACRCLPTACRRQ